MLISTLPTYSQVSLSTGIDVRHDFGHGLIELRYFNKSWPHWSVYIGTDETAGFDFYYTWNDLELGLGIEYADKDDYIVDTYLGYALRAEYRFNKNWSIGLKHRSNCSEVCNNFLLEWARIGKDNSNNQGFNYLYIRWRDD